MSRSTLRITFSFELGGGDDSARVEGGDANVADVGQRVVGEASLRSASRILASTGSASIVATSASSMAPAGFARRCRGRWKHSAVRRSRVGRLDQQLGHPWPRLSEGTT